MHKKGTEQVQQSEKDQLDGEVKHEREREREREREGERNKQRTARDMRHLNAPHKMHWFVPGADRRRQSRSRLAVRTLDEHRRGQQRGLMKQIDG